MLESYSYTGADVAQDVRDKFGDTGNVQITDAMLLRWINAGAQEIASQSPWLQLSAQTPLLAGQALYDLATLFANQRMLAITAVVVGGAYLKVVPWTEYERTLQDHLDQAASQPTLASLYGASLNLWPVPDETVANGITIYFTAYPAKIEALTEPLSVPDRFVTALRDLVLTNTLELDENFDAAQVKLGHYQERMRQQFARQGESPDDFYPSIVDLTYVDGI